MLTEMQIEAASLMFMGQMGEQAIADRVHVDPRTLRRWRSMPEFIAELEQLHNDVCAGVHSHILAFKEGRINAKLERYRALHQIIADRITYANPESKGDRTGLMTRKVLITKKTEYVYSVLDTALCRELSRLEKEIAHELGQDRQDPQPQPQPATIINRSALTAEEAEMLDSLLAKATESAPSEPTPEAAEAAPEQYEQEYPQRHTSAACQNDITEEVIPINMEDAKALFDKLESQHKETAIR
jgi:hypothetical protein